MAEVVWLYEGDDITEHVQFRPARFRSQANAQVGQANIRVRDREHMFAPGYFHAGGTLECWIDGERQWDGWVMVVAREYAFDVDDTTVVMATPRFWVLTGLDRNLLFQRRHVYNQDRPTQPFPDFPEGTTDQEALLEVANNWLDLSGDGLDLSGITEIDSPGQGEPFVLGEIGAMWGVTFEDCSKITGGVYCIDPDRVVRYVDDQTVTAPFILSDNPAATPGSVGYREVDDADDGMEMANDALVWGAGRGNASPVFFRYENDDLIEEYGRWQWADQAIGASRQETVRKRARTYVEGSPEHNRGHGDPLPTVRLVTFQTGFRAGQVARFIHETYGIDRPLPIMSVTATFPTQGDPMYELELSLRYDTPFMRVDPWTTPDIDLDDPEAHPPEVGDDAQVIDEFDRERFPTDPDWTAETQWGEASNGYTWVGDPAKDAHVTTGLGWAYANEEGDDDEAHGPEMLLDFTPVPRVTYWRWRMIPGDTGPNVYGWDMFFMPISAPEYLAMIHFGPTDPFGTPFASSGSGDGTGAYGWYEMTLDAMTDWRYTLIELDDDEFRVKTWREDDPEPEEWTIQMSWDDWNAGITGWGAGPDSFKVGFNFYGNVVSSNPHIEVDFIRAFGLRLGSPGTANSQNEAFNWDGGNLYQTAYPYLIGTLRIWLDGVALRWGIDYIESDPDQGEFTLTSDFLDMAQGGVADRLTVRYRRDVSYPTQFKEGPNRGQSSVGYTGGRVYRPARQRQMGWGTRYDGVNCTAASAAMCLDRDSEGSFSPSSGTPRATPPNIRSFSGVTAVEGLSMGNCVTAWDSGWGRDLNYYGLVSFGAFEDLVNEGRGSIVMGLYSIIQDFYPSYAYSRTFRGPHAMYVNEQFDDGSFLVYDPLANRVLVYSREQLRHYMQSWTPQGLCNASFSRVTDVAA